MLETINSFLTKGLNSSKELFGATASDKPELLIFAAIIIPLLVYIYGVWKGATGRITVYRNFNDVMLVALLVLVPTTALSIFINFSDIKELNLAILYTVITLETLFLIVILVRTWQDNKKVFSTLLALYVKLPTGILFFAQFFNMFGGETRKKRRESVFWTLMLLPLLYALVKDKKTGFLPRISNAKN